MASPQNIRSVRRVLRRRGRWVPLRALLALAIAALTLPMLNGPAYADGSAAPATDTSVVQDRPATATATATAADQPVADDPAATDPAATDPAATDPATSDPAGTDPTANDPAATASAEKTATAPSFLATTRTLSPAAAVQLASVTIGDLAGASYTTPTPKPRPPAVVPPAVLPSTGAPADSTLWGMVGGLSLILGAWLMLTGRKRGLF